MNNKVENPKVPVPASIELNDRDDVNLILEYEKNMSDNLSVALNEMSNQLLYEEIFGMFTATKNMARDLYNFMFKCGWYSLEKAETNKISEKKQECITKLQELS